MAIATVSIVSTIGLWNLFATPSKVEKNQPASKPPVAPPTETPVDAAPTAMPYVKIMFTQAAPQASVVQQVQQPVRKKKNRNKNDSGGNAGAAVSSGGGGGSVSVTQTKTS